MTDQKRATVLGHLVELRKRLIRSVIAVVITSILSFIFAKQIFDILLSPAPQDINLIYIGMTEMIGTYMKVCMASGIILAMPYLTYQLIMFTSPGLTRREKRYVYLVLPWIALMFATGVVFAYFILIPRLAEFLLTWPSGIATPQPRIGNYISFVTRLLLSVGLVFEMPVVTTVLARLGIIKPKWLADQRKPAIIIAFILAAMITPTIDPISQSLVAVPLVILYEMSIWLAKLFGRKHQKAVTSVPPPAS